MKLKLRVLGDGEAHILDVDRDIEGQEARAREEGARIFCEVGDHSLHAEYARMVARGPGVYNLRAEGPRARALNSELAGLEFYGASAHYHPASDTAALSRNTGPSLSSMICLLDFANGSVSDLVAHHELRWRSLASGLMLLQDTTSFSTLSIDRKHETLVAGHVGGEMIEDILIAFNGGSPRHELTLADPVAHRVEDYIGEDELSTLLDLALGGQAMETRYFHRRPDEIVFEVRQWLDGTPRRQRLFAVGITEIAMGTQDD